MAIHEPILCHDCYPNPQGGVVVCRLHLQGAALLAEIGTTATAARPSANDELAEWRPRIVKLAPSTLAADPTQAPLGIRARVFPYGYRGPACGCDKCGEDARVREQAQRSIDA